MIKTLPYDSKTNLQRVNVVYLVITLFLSICNHQFVNPHYLWLWTENDVVLSGIGTLFIFGWFLLLPQRHLYQKKVVWYSLGVLFLSIQVFLTSQIMFITKFGEKGYPPYESYCLKTYLITVAILLLSILALSFTKWNMKEWQKDKRHYVVAVLSGVFSIGITFTVLTLIGLHTFHPFIPIKESYAFMIMSIVLACFGLAVLIFGLKNVPLRLVKGKTEKS